MELSDAASFFDDQPVLDAYTLANLFYGQPDLYDASRKDAEAGWRRSISAGTIVASARGCFKIGSEFFISGRIVKDYFEAAVIREHMLLHPSDGLLTVGAPEKFLGVSGSTTAHAGVSWIKEKSEEARTSELWSVYDVHCSVTETIPIGYVLKDTDLNYFRVVGDTKRTGGLLVLVAYELGADVLRSVSYTVSGAFVPANDSSSTSAPFAVDAFVENYKVGYNYIKNASEQYERSDRIVTLRQAVVADPKPGDTLVDQTITFRVLSRQSDGFNCWRLHVRPV